MNRFVNLVEILSEGEISGLVNGANSIYLDQTPLVNANGTKNFTGVSFDLHTGTAAQSYFNSNPTAETTISVGTALLAAGVQPIKTINDANATSVRLLFTVPSLSSSGPGGDAAWQIDWAVDVRPAGGSWSQVATSSTGYNFFNTAQTFQTVVNLPATGYPWDIRVRRTTGDPGLYPVWNGAYYQNYTFTGDLIWESYTQVVSAKLSYPYTAACALVIDANAFGNSSLPARSYRVKGIKIDVPTNYNPTTRVYTGVWDGTFTKAWTNNPAWILRDLIVNDRYGLGEFMTDAMVDKWALYQIAQYCDQSVPDGYGGTEPRYTLNCQITNKTEAFKLIQSIATVFRGMAFWSMNSVYAVADMPSDPVKLYSNANVINGEFNYSGTAIKARHSVALVTWYDPTDFYRPAVEVVIDDEMVKRYGWRELNMEAMGCTTRSLANRYGRWALDTEKNASETVEFVAGWDSADIKPGDIIAVADVHKAQVRAGGRIVSVSGTAVTLDAAFAPGSGQTYSLMVELPDKTVVTKAISSFSNGNTVANIASAFSTAPQIGAMWTITGTDIAPRQFRVVAREEREAHLFHLSALAHDPTKYARIEQGISFDPLPYFRPPPTIKPPTNLAFTETTFQQNGVYHNRLLLSWTPADDFLAVGYRIIANTPQGYKDYGQIVQTNYSIDDPPLGVWNFSIYAASIEGLLSEALTGSKTVAGYSSGGAYVDNLEVSGGGSDYSGQSCTVTWLTKWPDGTTGTSNAAFKDFQVRVYDIATNTLKRTETVTSQTYTYTYAKNTTDFTTPKRAFRIEVTVRTLDNYESAPTKLAVNNPIPEMVMPTITTSLTQIFVTFTPPADPDYAGCKVWLSTTSGFDPATTTPSYTGSNTALSFAASPSTTYYIRLGCYDSFNQTEMNISPEVTAYIIEVVADTSAPAVPTGLTLSTVALTKADGSIDYQLTADWNDSASTNFGYFNLEIAEDAVTPVWVSYPTATSIYTWTGLKANQLYRVKVAAVSRSGYSSAFTAVSTLTTATKTTAPAAPTSLTATTSLKSVFLAWTNPTDKDLAGIEIWRNTTNSSATATKVASTLGAAFTDAGLTTGTTYYYWLKAYNTSGVTSTFSTGASATPGQISNADLSTGIAAQLATAGELVVYGIYFSYVASTNVLSWTAGTVLYYDSAGVASSRSITAGNVTWTTGTTFVYWVRGGTTFSTSTTSPLSSTDNVTFATYTGGSNLTVSYGIGMVDGVRIGANSVSASQIAANTITASQIAANTITASQIAANTITATQIATGTITASQIAAGTITSDRIQAGTITGDRLSINTSLPATITIGATGVTIGEITDPGTLINGGTTLIAPGKIQISGATTLSSWQNGTDATKIEGGSIAANTISANKMTIGMRGIDVAGVQFSWASNVASWTAGVISYTNDAGTIVTASITSGSTTTWTTGTIYIAWAKGATSLVSGTSPYSTDTHVTLATYRGAGDLVANYGRTIIDGSNIVTGSITANQIAAGAITATQLAADSVTAVKIAAGAITADKIGAGTISATNSIFLGGTSFELSATNQNLVVKDTQAAQRVRVKIGRLGAATTDYGIQIYDSSGNLMLSSTGGSALSAISANLGTVTAGLMQSTDGKFVIDLTNKTITISD